MVEKQNISLKKYNTLHLEAKAKKFYIPQNEFELISLIKQLDKERKSYNILSGGSNVLINNTINNVIYMSNVDKKKEKIKDNLFYIGASCRIQEVIRYANKNNYGGFEELYCLPALFGGIVYMNAGIGGKNNQKFDISNFIYRVKVINKDTYKIEWIYKKDCLFEYRKSIFQMNKYIILGAEILLKKQDKYISDAKIKKRIEYCRNNQEWSKGCFGTCFSTANIILLKIARFLKKKSGLIAFGSKNPNWIVNNGNGTYKDVMRLIKLCNFLHKITFQKIELEVKILNDNEEI